MSEPTGPPPAPQAPQIKSSQRKWLRGQAHSLDPIVHVGKAGVTDAVVVTLQEALTCHELIKVRLHAPDDKKALAAELGSRAGADIVGLIGHIVILYRPHPTEPKLALPE